MLYKHFHDHVKKSRNESAAPIDPKDWPQDWKEIYFREYPRFPKIKLVLPRQKPDFKLIQALKERKSERNFNDKPVNLKELSQLLIYGAGVVNSRIKNQKSKLQFKIQNDLNNTRRTYPSGGGRYTIELYPLVLKPTKELPVGFYHFNFKENVLENLWLASELDLKKLLIGDWGNAALIILMSAVFDRTMNKYQDFGYRLIWAECGHIGQNFYLVSQALGLKCCACAGVNEDYANELLDLDGENESVLMAYIFGH